METSVLRELGLSDKEIKIYLTLLKLGQSTVNLIAKKANLNREVFTGEGVGFLCN